MMDFQKIFKINTTKEKVFEAATTGINKWWGNVDNELVNKVGDEFSIFFEENTEWRFLISSLEKYNKVSWKCIYANHSFSGLKGIKEEWLNSEIDFEFKTITDDEIELSFTHNGLTPNLNCYEICSAGWTHFIANSLKQFLETGTGKPNFVPHN